MTISAAKHDAEEHTNTLADFLPNGPLFEAKNIGDSNFRKLLRGFAGELFTAEGYIKTFDDEYSPLTTVLFIEEWERALGIPDACFLATGDIDERRTHVLTKLASLGIQTTDDFVALGSVFGKTITVEALNEMAPPPVAVTFPDARFTIVVTGTGIVEGLPPYDVPFTPGPSESVLECLFDKLKPSNSKIIFLTADLTWVQVGNSLAIAAVSFPALAALNDMDVAFIDITNDSLRTYRFDGTDWVLVGNGLAIAISVPALTALSGTDVAFIDFTNSSLRKYRFDGTDWAQVGNGLAIAAVGAPALAALNGTDVAFIDDTNKSLRKYRFDGTDWAQVGNGLAIAAISAPALAALNGTDVAFIDFANDSLRTYRFDGTDWAQVGNGLAIATVGRPALAALNGTDIAFIDDSNDSLRTYRFDGTNWAQHGDSLPVTTVGSPALAALNSTDIAFIDATNDELRTYRFGYLLGSGP